MPFCGEHSTLAQQDGVAFASVLRCRRWTCEDCFPRCANRLRRIVAEGAPNKLLTLTVNPRRYDSDDAAARDLVKAWRHLRLTLIRKGLADRIPFCAVFEQTRRGKPHLHVALRCGFLPQRWLSRAMGKLTGAPVVDIRAFRKSRALAAYLAKYLSKCPHRWAGTKRYWRSQDWCDQWRIDAGPPIQTIDWQIAKRPFCRLRQSLLDGGMTVVEETDSSGWYAFPWAIHDARRILDDRNHDPP